MLVVKRGGRVIATISKERTEMNMGDLAWGSGCSPPPR